MTVYDLPIVNASLNAIATVLLLTARSRIRHHRIESHKKWMIAAFSVSVAFLICYIIYHITAKIVYFEHPVWFRPIYLTVLITHVTLAATVPFLATITLIRGLKRKDARHRKIARWTYPIWLYVSVTGVVIYLLLYQIFPQTIH